jgi:hypothetical protein
MTEICHSNTVKINTFKYHHFKQTNQSIKTAKKSHTNLSNIIKRKTNHTLFMTLERLHKFRLFHIPQLNSRISTTRNQVSRITRKLTIPHPPKMTLQRLILIQSYLLTVGNYLVQLYLLVRRTRRQVLAIWRYLTLQNVVLMHLELFLEMHVRQRRVYEPLAVGENYVLSVLAY